MNFLRVIRNNWKKSAFGAVATGYGFMSLKSYYETTQYMRSLCNSIIENPGNWRGETPKNVLVVMNPTANKKKAEKSFKQYCEPILHLAGYSVEIFKTNQIGHAKTYIENMNRLPDAIVVAGGDGTSSEVITGLLRRSEPPCPIALLPLGRKNESASRYLNINSTSDLDYVKGLTSALIPMLEERVKYENVIQYDVIEKEANDENRNLKPIYGLNRFSWGLLKDIDEAKDNYWYFGGLRHYAAAFISSFSNKMNWNFKAQYVYTPPCPGCNNCFVEKSKQQKPTTFLSKLLFSKASETKPAQMYLSNDNCNTEIQGYIETNQLNIACSKNEDNFFQLESEFVNSLQPGWDFIKNIPNITKNVFEPSVVLKSRTIQLYPEPNEKNLLYFIDGEEYDARPIKVSIVPKAIKVYC